MKELEIYDKEIWLLLENKINDDEWYTNFKESLYALESLSVLHKWKS